MCLAVPGEIVSIDENDPLLRMAQVRFGGVLQGVSLAMTPEACRGQYVLVHAGLAIQVLDEAEAAATLASLEQLGEQGP